MARHLPGFAGTRLEILVALITSYPFTIGGWMFPTSETSTSGSMFSVGDSSGQSHWTIQLDPGLSDDIRFKTQGAQGPNRIAEKAVTVEINEWHFGAATGASSTLRTIYMDWDGINHKATNTFGVTPTDLDITMIGRQTVPIPQQYFGDLCEIFICDEVLEEEQLESLSGAEGDLLAPYTIYGVDPWSCTNWFSLLGGGDDPGLDIIGGMDMAAVDTGAAITHAGSPPTPGPHGLN